MRGLSEVSRTGDLGLSEVSCFRKKRCIVDPVLACYKCHMHDIVVPQDSVRLQPFGGQLRPGAPCMLLTHCMLVTMCTIVGLLSGDDYSH